MVVEIEHQNNGVALMRITQIAARNAFNPNSMSQIADSLEGLIADSSVRAVVLTGEENFFCAGADIEGFEKAIKSNEIVDLIHQLTGRLHPLIIGMRRSSTIMIAAINGAAAGGGLGLALACDVRIACPEAKLAAAYARLGLSPDGGTTWLLPRLVGEQTARRFILENEVWDGQTAFEFGAVDEIVPSKNLIEHSINVASKLGNLAEHTREATKHLFDLQSTQDLETHLHHERLLIKAAGITTDFNEGVKSFLEKREPKFN